MDSVTQAALGASIGGAVLGRSAGRKAVAWGAICGTLPDLDTFYPFADVVSAFTYHRSVSHSLLVLSAVTPLIAWLIVRVHPHERERSRRWLLLVWLALLTHPLLDACTIYGTQLLWPVSDYPVAWSNVFIIDPVFTVPLLAAVSFALLGRPAHGEAANRHGVAINRAALAFGFAYLCMGAFIKTHVDAHVRASAQRQGIEAEQLISSPILFNIVLWRTVIMSGGEYHESFYSLLDPPGEVKFASYPTQPELLETIEEQWAVRRLAWFTKGYFGVRLDGKNVVLSDLRMGYEPAYVFRFVLGRRTAGEIASVAVRQLARPATNVTVLSAGWRRTLGDIGAL